ncbi:unnamed protein product [Cyprideis torosa]|uniref:Uncharacterized protein n=1 Tax=Cyprideis torosa TaxID=163714 RepID=A0A7R8WKM3_9CRUS|nr:unnamed protein product [Cyprideis torosa]CAG0903298.1 unnamed protein product [Cyprideis torosa]
MNVLPFRENGLTYRLATEDDLGDIVRTWMTEFYPREAWAAEWNDRIDWPNEPFLQETLNHIGGEVLKDKLSIVARDDESDQLAGSSGRRTLVLAAYLVESLRMKLTIQAPPLNPFNIFQDDDGPPEPFALGDNNGLPDKRYHQTMLEVPRLPTSEERGMP